MEAYDIRARELGEKIRQKIRSAGMKQAEFAKKLEISPSRLSNYITGARLPDIFVLRRIAEELGLTVDFLCGNDTDRCYPKKYTLTVFEGGMVKINEEAD